MQFNNTNIIKFCEAFDKDVVKHIVQTAKIETLDDISNLEYAISSDDLAKTQSICHKLRGSMGNIGFKYVKSRKSGKDMSLEEASELLTVIKQQTHIIEYTLDNIVDDFFPQD